MARRALAWIGDRAPADVVGVSAAVGGAGGIVGGLSVSGQDPLTVLSSAAGVGAAVGGVAGIGLWAACRSFGASSRASAAERFWGRRRGTTGDQARSGPAAGFAPVFCDRVPALPRVFLGRDRMVRDLVGVIASSGGRVRVYALVGLGGVGKTSVAAAVAERVRDRVEVVWWARGDQPRVLVADLAGLARHVGLPEIDDAAATARAVRAWLETTTHPWLLVFDQVLNLASFEEWLPKRGGGAVLVTSRSNDVHRVADVVTVETVEPQVAGEFLRARVGTANPRAAHGGLDGVVARLGGLPLALEQAAAWVSRAPTRTFDQFCGLYDDALVPMSDDTRPIGYEHTVATTWQVSVAAATQEAPQAGHLLAVLSFLAPTELPCAWLRDRAGHPFLEAADETAIDAALVALHSYALVTLKAGDPGELDDTVVVHPVIQAATRRVAFPDAAGFAIDVLAAQAHGGDQRDHQNWPLLETLLPHVHAVATTARAALPGRAEPLCALLDWVGLFEDARGAPRSALATINNGLDLAGSHLGPDHPVTLTLRVSLAYAHHMVGDVQQAVSLLEPTLADCERVLGDEHQQTLRSRNNLAGAYEWLGDVERAIPLHEVTLAARERILGRDDVATLQSRHNLATAHRVAGHLDQAIELYEVTLADMERVLSREHPSTLLTRTDRALTYLAAGGTDLAVSLLEGAAADYERIQGRHHPGTLRCRGFLAAAYGSAGQRDRAVALYEATLADTERVLGPDHPYTRRARAGLAQLREAPPDAR